MLLYVKLECWPDGFEDDKEPVGSIKIIGDETGYSAEIYDENRKVIRTCHADGFPNARDEFDLLCEIIKNSVKVKGNEHARNEQGNANR